jgi:subtilisin family serine protease
MKYKKFAAGLLHVMQAQLQERPIAATASRFKALGLVAKAKDTMPPRAIVFLHCKADADLTALKKHGISVNQESGEVRTAFLSVDKLEVLAEHGAITRIGPSRAIRPLMDIAPGKVKLPTFKTSSGLTGNGVVVGVVDSGIDPKHPDFGSRIHRIWDQTLSGTGVTEGAFGVELSGTQLTRSGDTNGHGTHVSGIAAGSGSQFGGVAPKADIVMVKTDFNDAHIADGIRYIFRVARDLGKPAVVNLSLGGHFDAHDGTDALSQIIDSESGPGRIVCCAAGNEGNDNIHAQVKLGAAATRSVRFQIPANSVGVAMLNGWYPGSGTLEIAIRSPDGRMTPFQPVITSGNPLGVHSLPMGQVQMETGDVDPSNGDHNFFITIRANASGGVPVMGGIWQLQVRNAATLPGKLDIWALDDQEAPTVMFTGTSAQDTMKIGSPGCSLSAVTVAAYTSRDQWTDIDGIGRQVGLTVDDISDFSSEGPLRSRKKKPDVTAPGAMIASCLSSKSTPQRSSMIDAQHLLEAGTSMATPFISGVVALLLERKKTLSPAQVKKLLKANSLIPGKPAGTFDTKWGFGLLNCGGL